MTGVFVASDISKPSETGLTIEGQVRSRIEQPELRFHREGVGALLHDRGAFAVILADDDHRPAGQPPDEERLASASEATLTPTAPLKVTAPRIG